MEDNAVVWRALLTNALIAGLKALAGVLGGSPAMLSEAAHSVVDSSTEVILMGGALHARRWEAARYFWGLVASINMFAIGGLYAIWEGYQAIVDPSAGVTDVWFSLAVLAVSAGLEATSWVRAFRSLATERAGRSWYTTLRTTRSTDIKAVAIEDSADILGCVLAAVGLVLRVFTGFAWDGVASILIGLLMIGLAYELGSQNLKLLTSKESVTLC